MMSEFMKKYLSILLSAVLLLSAVFVAIPMAASADNSSIVVRPVDSFGINNNWNSSYTNAVKTYPLSITNVSGLTVSVGSSGSFEITTGKSDNWKTVSLDSIDEKYETDETHLMFYVKTDGKTVLYFSTYHYSLKK